MTTVQSELGSVSLLDRVYADLDLVNGTLLDAATTPFPDAAPQHWREVGDWLLLAERVNADRVFFVNDDPVLVFSSLPCGSDEADVLDCYRRTWSLARPRCLFLAIGGELRVYSLASPPPAPGSSQKPLKPLHVVNRAADVGDRLAQFHRARLESGATFEDSQLATQSGRADQQLLRDVHAVTEALVNADLPARVAHTLIERAILVRYLEDREIITEDYFDTITVRHSDALHVAMTEHVRPNFGRQSRFTQLLASKDITYDLFDKLSQDFNGDLFVADPSEHDVVADDHLRLLMELLQGNATADQTPLFLWAYDFSVVPINLISAMYEMFYRDEVDEASSSMYYTPPALVEFVLSDVLDQERLDQEPTICDPACGSGIFLVEAYRRIVRHEVLRAGRPLSSQRLRELLLRRIAGCDLDEGAVRLAAFSLYIAFLNYQSPQDIQRAGPLPRLIHRAGLDSGDAPLVVGDAFWPLTGALHPDAVTSEAADEELPWVTRSFDVVVGNPPWTEIKGEKNTAEKWARRLKRAFGDRSPSQLFLWRTLDLLADGGVAALLVSAKTMFNTRSTSQAFRAEWLRNARLEHVVNFSRVRRHFFTKAAAPFMLLRFSRADRDADSMFIYETARPVPRGRHGSPALARLERQVVSQASVRARDYLWKTYSDGSIRDDAFMTRLAIEARLRAVIGSQPQGHGFQRAADEQAGRPPSTSLRELRSLARFDSWGPLEEEWFESIPPFVKLVPDERIFRGQRLLVRRFVSTDFGPHARLETEPFAFRHTVYGASLDHLPPWQAKVILGTLLSSLGRYWLYMVSGSWGTWSDEVRSSTLLDIPLRLTSASDPATRRIEEAVDELQHVIPERGSRGWRADLLPRQMAQVDEGVSDLFRLTDAERDLVADFWSAQRKDGMRPLPAGVVGEGTADDLDPRSREGIEPYLRVFLSIWNRRLEGTGEFGWRVWRDPRTDVIAVVFETRETGGAQRSDEGEQWSAALHRLGVQWEAPESQGILRYGMVRAVSDTAIIVVKRNERHQWTATAARQDADATTAQVMAVERR